MNSELRDRLTLWVGIAMAAVAGLTLFSWVALSALVEPGAFGASGRLALNMAFLPSRVQKAWEEALDNITGEEAIRHLAVPRPEMDMTGFRPVTMVDGSQLSGLMVRGDLARADRGWRLLGGAMQIEGRAESAVALLDPNLTVQRLWVLDEDDVQAQDKSLASRRVLHGLTMEPESGAIVFNLDFGSAVQKRDMCNRPIWIAEGKYHHSVMPVDGGMAYWTLRDDGFATQHLSGDPATPHNTGFVKLDAATGEVLQEFGLEELIAANPGLGVFELGRVDEEEAQSNAAGVVGRWRPDPMHFNDADPLPPHLAGAFPQFEVGDLLVSARNINTVLVIDPDTLKVKWHQTGGFLRQHDPDWQPDGSISVFDNGMGAGQSRILKIDVSSHGISTTYDDGDFYTRVRGKHMRTGRGDLAVVSPQQGRAFEMGTGGAPVLEFVNLMPGSDDRSFGLNEYQWLPEGAVKAGDTTCTGS
ncbi:arylsulfotransferase family protein [Alisedimentitalea sp. MJ-SS2]|uniref:arylsulfotransferase family protein n=1 Tax=Aliisedimentitalea sp. MJ-SS2 TaxID=3049795 RepID=UPI00290E64D4|nr:arylsulfotransferase family protein [Alisedimentitalea sp. MJ-SS2]MDU8928861.1 arylsulfotransferase family protein [Alisedimentitalea sp. MJ-SS2]